MLRSSRTRTVRDFQRHPYGSTPILLSYDVPNAGTTTLEFEDMLVMLANPVDAPSRVADLRLNSRMLPGDVVVTHADTLSCPFALAVASRRLRTDQTGARVHVWLYRLQQGDDDGFEWLLPTKPLEERVLSCELVGPHSGQPPLLIMAEQLQLREVLRMGTVFRLSDQLHDTISECLRNLDVEHEPSDPEPSDEEDEAMLRLRRERHVAHVSQGLTRARRSRAPSRALIESLCP